MIGGVDKIGGGKAEKYQITFNLTPKEATLVVKDLKGNIILPKEKNIYVLETGIYTYTASAKNYITKENIRLEVYQEAIIDVRLDESYEIVSFSEGTDDQIRRMLNAHYNGEIDISEHWHVGDTRLVHLNAMSAGTGASETHVAQDITMVIIGINHDELRRRIGIRARAAITVQCRETLGNNGEEEKGYIWGTSTKLGSDDAYYKNPRRTWLNNTFISAMPENFAKLTKPIFLKTLTNHYNNNSDTTEDRAFLLSISQIFGNKSISYYSGNMEIEGEQYEYYKISDNTKKYINNNGIKGTKLISWWTRSPSREYDSDFGYRWFEIYSSGTYSVVYGNNSLGLAPAFCL